MKNLTTNLTLAAALTLALSAFGGMAHAEDAKPEAKPDNEVSYNVALTSDYRYRGVSQSRLDPALQGGVDYVHNPTGLYAGTWLSTIKWTKDLGGSGDVEMDIYGGKKGEIATATRTTCSPRQPRPFSSCWAMPTRAPPRCTCSPRNDTAKKSPQRCARSSPPPSAFQEAVQPLATKARRTSEPQGPCTPSSVRC